jgi:hypothetical protein
MLKRFCWVLQRCLPTPSTSFQSLPFVEKANHTCGKKGVGNRGAGCERAALSRSQRRLRPSLWCAVTLNALLRVSSIVLRSQLHYALSVEITAVKPSVDSAPYRLLFCLLSV